MMKHITQEEEPILYESLLANTDENPDFDIIDMYQD